MDFDNMHKIFFSSITLNTLKSSLLKLLPVRGIIAIIFRDKLFVIDLSVIAIRFSVIVPTIGYYIIHQGKMNLIFTLLNFIIILITNVICLIIFVLFYKWNVRIIINSYFFWTFCFQLWRNCRSASHCSFIPVLTGVCWCSLLSTK